MTHDSYTCDCENCSKFRQEMRDQIHIAIQEANENYFTNNIIKTKKIMSMIEEAYNKAEESILHFP